MPRALVGTEVSALIGTRKNHWWRRWSTFTKCIPHISLCTMRLAVSVTIIRLAVSVATNRLVVLVATIRLAVLVAIIRLAGSVATIRLAVLVDTIRLAVPLPDKLLSCPSFSFPWPFYGSSVRRLKIGPDLAGKASFSEAAIGTHLAAHQSFSEVAIGTHLAAHQSFSVAAIGTHPKCFHLECVPTTRNCNRHTLSLSWVLFLEVCANSLLEAHTVCANNLYLKLCTLNHAH